MTEKQRRAVMAIDREIARLDRALWAAPLFSPKRAQIGKQIEAAKHRREIALLGSPVRQFSARPRVQRIGPRVAAPGTPRMGLRPIVGPRPAGLPPRRPPKPAGAGAAGAPYPEKPVGYTYATEEVAASAGKPFVPSATTAAEFQESTSENTVPVLMRPIVWIGAALLAGLFYFLTKKKGGVSSFKLLGASPAKRAHGRAH